MKTPREIVLEYHPTAYAVNVGCKNGNGKYYNIIKANNHILGQGKSSKNAWKSAYHNL